MDKLCAKNHQRCGRFEKNLEKNFAKVLTQA